MMISYVVSALLLLALTVLNVANSQQADDPFQLPRRFLDSVDNGSEGTKWAVLVAGSSGYENYRHQADVCHAYQILKNGGLKDENIIVFMYDDIAQNSDNPKRGVIINKPGGEDVYKGVPKDYVKHQVTANNFYAVILGNKTALTGGSRKVVDSGPNDHIFIFYSDHGAAGIVGMPEGPNIMANDLINVLKKKHASGTYKSLVFYLEACEAGSMFEGLLPRGMNIYATTASNSSENSWASYCDSEDGTCLGDLYSVSWMEDSEKHNLETETLKQQYQGVKKRTKLGNADGTSSNVMQYGDIKQSVKTLSMFMGAKSSKTYQNYTSFPSPTTPVNQRDADLIYFWHKFKKAPQGSAMKVEARKELVEAMAHRMHVDSSVELIGKLLFGIENAPKMMAYVRQAGQPVVDDWDCLKSTVRTFETYCGSLSQYGIKHMRSFANICNAHVKTEQMASASAKACPSISSNPWSSLKRGFSV